MNVGKYRVEYLSSITGRGIIVGYSTAKIAKHVRDTYNAKSGNTSIVAKYTGKC